jgi:hypothetical protein
MLPGMYIVYCSFYLFKDFYHLRKCEKRGRIWNEVVIFYLEDHALTEAAGCRLLTADTQVQSRATSSENGGEQSGNGAGFSLNSSVFPR